MTEKAKKIQETVLAVKGRNVQERRIEALRKEGFKVGYPETRYNFGTVGTVIPEEGGYQVQIGAAKSGKAKNGFSINFCPTVHVY